MRRTMKDNEGRILFVGQRVLACSQGVKVRTVIKRFIVKKKEAEVQILNQRYNFYHPIDLLEIDSSGRDFSKDNF